jgi:hypothetical protein
LTALRSVTGAGNGIRSTPVLAYVSIRQHTSAYVSIRQHTSALKTESIRFLMCGLPRDQHTYADVCWRMLTCANTGVLRIWCAGYEGKCMYGCMDVCMYVCMYVYIYYNTWVSPLRNAL